MDEPIHQEEYKGYTIKIYTDPDPISPREMDNLGLMACFHSRYNLGDEIPEKTPEEFLKQLTLTYMPDKTEDELDDLYVDDLVSMLSDFCVIKNLYLMDHSGLSISMSPFGCPWDSGQVGWVVVPHGDIRGEYGVQSVYDKTEVTDEHGNKITKRALDAAIDTLESEVKEYNAFIQGNVYGFEISGPDTVCNECGQTVTPDPVESCWGLIDDTGGVRVIEEAKSAIEPGRA